MGNYKVDERDVHFNLFEYLKAQDLNAFEKYKDHNEELYKMVIGEALKFAKNELDPINAPGDKESVHMKDGKVITPKGYKEAFRKAAENGFMAIDTSTTYGGQGLPALVMSAMTEYFCGANVAMEIYLGLTRGGSQLIEEFAKPELGKLFCEKMNTGVWAGTMCLTEPQAGTAVGDLATTATPNSDGTFNIKGNKIFISGGDQDLTENIVHLVLARVVGDAPGTKGISLFIVPKFWVNADGSQGAHNDVNCVNVEHKMGIRASATCSLNFGENGKCRGFLLGEKSQGMKYMFKLMNEARLLCGMQGLALGGAAYENALVYAKDRVQGGKTVIINYPDVRRNLMLCKSWVEGMRALLYYTAKQIDYSHNHSDPAVKERSQNRADLLTPVCKAYCSDMGFRVTEIAIQVYGGAGFISEYPAEQYMRDTKIASIYEGANGIQALDLMGRKLSLKGGQLFKEYYEDIAAFCSAGESNAELKPHTDALKKSLDSVAQTAMKIAEWGLGGDQNKAMLAATPFLEMVGHVSIAYFLLEQATIAAAKIKAGSNEVFYRNKIRTARFFVQNQLPHVQMRAKAILSEDQSALEMEF